MKLLVWVLVVFAPLCLLAQVTVSPMPTAVPFATPNPSPSLISTMTSLLSFARGWQSMELYACIAAALKVLADLSKLSFLGNPWAKIPDQYKLLAGAFIGAALVFLGFLAAGVPLLTALSAAIGSSAGAGFIHEVLKDFFPGAEVPDVKA